MADEKNTEAAQSIIEAYMKAAASVDCKGSLKEMCGDGNGIEKGKLIEQMKEMGKDKLTLKDHIVAYLSAYDAKKVEEKKTRTNLKKLGCLFEAFLGALFLDFNKISIHDDDKWFDNVFVTGPGFQIAQIFVESIFEAHINWTELLMSNDNYKNLLQVKLQKAFQVTPIYKEIEEYDEEEGYHMGVYLSINIDSHNMKHDESIHYSEFKDDASVIDAIKYYLENTKDSIYMFLGESKHKIKKKAEQEACRLAIQNLNNKNKD